MDSLKRSRTGEGKLVVAFLHMSVLVDSVSPRRLPINGQTMSWINHFDREQMGMVKRGGGCQEAYMVKRGGGCLTSLIHSTKLIIVCGHGV